MTVTVNNCIIGDMVIVHIYSPFRLLLHSKYRRSFAAGKKLIRNRNITMRYVNGIHCPVGTQSGHLLIIHKIGEARSTHRKDKMQTKFLSENLKGRVQFGDLGVEGRITLKWVLKKLYERGGLD
jgi:hypothetical protein